MIKTSWFLAITAGLALTLGFAPFNLWPLALVGLAVWSYVVRTAPSRKAATRLSLAFGMAHGVSALYWLPWAFWHDSESLLFAIFGGIPAMLAVALWAVLGYVLAGRWAWRWRGRAAFWLVWGGVLLVIEGLRMLTPFGFPWLPLGAVWAGGMGTPYLAQMASLGGVTLLSLLLLVQAGLVACLQPWAWRVAALLIALQWLNGYVRVQRPQPVPEHMVRIVQPNLGTGHKWDAVKRWEFLNDTLTIATLGQDPNTQAPSLVILPETGVPFFINETPEVGAMLAQAFPSPTQVLTGAIRRELVWNGGQPTTQYFNSLQRVDAGHVAGSYDKRLLVPFGEFIPLREVLDALPLPMPLRVLSQARMDFTHGTLSPLLPTAIGPMVGLICYEGIFPLFVAGHSQGARALVNVTNDAWFTGTSALYQHAALQRLRAIETGLPLLRSANTGISFATDGFGRILGSLPPSQAGVLEIKLPAPLQTTPWKWLISGIYTF